MSATQTTLPATLEPAISSSESPPIPGPSIRATKRKLEDAFQTLDDAVGPSESLERPSPAKRVHTSRSLYSTLAKYGIKSKDSKSTASGNKSSALSKSTPHLTAILNRAATQTRKALPFKFSGQTSTNVPPPHSTTDYRPSSIPSFLSRLATFKLATYANKPPVIDAVAASKCGWINDGKDRLVCGICNMSWVVAGKEGMNRDAANALVEKQSASLVEMHKSGCPWKTRQCDPSIYRIPLQSPAVMVKGIKSGAVILDSVLQGVEIKHPLTSTQLNSLRSAISSFSLVSATSEDPEPSTMSTDSPPFSTASEPSETAVLTALFGWALAPPAPERPRPTSLSRANSVFSAPPTPSISRASSVLPSRDSTPTPGPSSSRPVPRASSDNVGKRDTSLLHCALCQRRVGLWAFAPPPHIPLVPNGMDSVRDAVDTSLATTGQSRARMPQRQFDLLKEHRSYCPYVVRSTIVPSLPVPSPGPILNGHSRSNSSMSQLNSQNGAFEGWRAVLTVVLRYGMGQRQRGLMRNYMEGGEFDAGDLATASGDSTETDGVEAMVAGVKSRGGRELLNYVKGLLG